MFCVDIVFGDDECCDVVLLVVGCDVCFGVFGVFGRKDFDGDGVFMDDVVD